MLGSNIPIENMSHLAGSFSLRTDNTAAGYVDRDIEGIHPTQQNKRRIKLMLLFVIPGDGGVPEDHLQEDQQPINLPRIASVRVPKGVPVAKLRPLIRHIEDQLQDIFGRSRRLNFVMTCNEDSENWTYVWDLPMFGVVYV